MRFASVTSSAAVSSLCLPTSARNSWRLSAGSGDLVGLEVQLCLGRLRLPFPARAELYAHGLELTREGLDVLVGEVVLECKRLELGRLDEPRSSAVSSSARPCSDSINSCIWLLVN